MRRGSLARVPVLLFAALACGCGGVPLFGSDPAAPRDRASQFDRFAAELFFERADTAPPLARARLQAMAPGLQAASAAPLGDARRRSVGERRMRAALDRLRSDFSPARLGSETPRASWARVLTRDLERALDLGPDGAPRRLDGAGAPRTLSPWTGAPFEAPSMLAREMPARTAADLARWKSAMLSAIGSIDPAERETDAPTVLERVTPTRARRVLAVLRDELRTLSAEAGSATALDPLFGPLAEALGRLPGAGGARSIRFEGAELRAISDALASFDDALERAENGLDERADARIDQGVALAGPARERWLARIADAAGPDADLGALSDLARRALVDVTRALGEPLGVEANVDAVQAQFGELRRRALRRSGAPSRGPVALWAAVEGGLEALVAAPHPEVHLASAKSRSFERPRGRWAPFVRGDLAPVDDPRARPALHLARRSRDPLANRLLEEPEALRYGLPGHGFVDAYRRAARDTPLAVRAVSRPTFEEGWSLYATAEAAALGLYAPEDGGLGWRVQELVALASILVDVGLHERGWSTEQAVETVLELTPLTELAARELVLRAECEPGRVALPGIGLLRMRALRSYVEEALGDAFDAPRFHRALLLGGPVPMAEADRRIERWLDLETRS
ncbi:MAG: DUF885 family protein [Planctomycetota bacterium]